MWPIFAFAMMLLPVGVVACWLPFLLFDRSRHRGFDHFRWFPSTNVATNTSPGWYIWLSVVVLTSLLVAPLLYNLQLTFTSKCRVNTFITGLLWIGIAFLIVSAAVPAQADFRRVLMDGNARSDSCIRSSFEIPGKALTVHSIVHLFALTLFFTCFVSHKALVLLFARHRLASKASLWWKAVTFVAILVESALYVGLLCLLRWLDLPQTRWYCDILEGVAELLLWVLVAASFASYSFEISALRMYRRKSKV